MLGLVCVVDNSGEADVCDRVVLKSSEELATESRYVT